MEPDPDMDPDPDPGGPKTCGFCGSGSPTLIGSVLALIQYRKMTRKLVSGLYLFARNFMFCFWPIYSGTSVADSDPGSSGFLAHGFAIRIRDGN
jgi:hypothetical protein